MKKLTILVWLCNLDNRAVMYWNKMQYYLNNLTMVRNIKHDVEFMAVVANQNELDQIKACQFSAAANEDVTNPREICKGITNAFIKTESKTKFLAKMKKFGKINSERIIFVDTEDFINLHNLEEVVNYLKENTTDLIQISNTKIGEEFSWEIKEGNPKPIHIKNSINKNTIYFTESLEELDNYDLDLGYDIVLSRIQQQKHKLVYKQFNQNFIAFDKSELVYTEDKNINEFVKQSSKLFEALSTLKKSKNENDNFPSMFNLLNVANSLSKNTILSKSQKKELYSTYVAGFKKQFNNGNRKLLFLTPMYIKHNMLKGKVTKPITKKSK